MDAILKAAIDLYGHQVHTFIVTALGTGGRRSELTGLTWDRVTLDGDDPSVLFTKTKSHRDRVVPIGHDVVTALRTLKIKTLQQRGPFSTLVRKLSDTWGCILEAANVDGLAIHDLRRTFITRLVNQGVPLKTVMLLAGHTAVATTMKYYCDVTEADKKAAILKLQSTARA